jgi:alpha,alpha-trehalase
MPGILRHVINENQSIKCWVLSTCTAIRYLLSSAIRIDGQNSLMTSGAFRRVAACAVALIPTWATAIGPPASQDAGANAPPSQLYGDLFAAVQGSGLFGDSKVFADAIARGTPSEILAAWNSQRRMPGFSLRQFVGEHFTLESEAVFSAPAAAHLDLCQHIAGLWPVLMRTMRVPASGSSLLPLPFAAVVPGGRFHEAYYWDSYFSLLGMAPGANDERIEGIVKNFAYLIDTYGHVPNGTRTYYLSRSQPPFFYEMVALSSRNDPAAAFARYLPQLRQEHAFWMDGEAQAGPDAPRRRVVALADGARLNRYWDDRAAPRDESYREDLALARASNRPADHIYRDIRAAAESGWDFSSRWLPGTTTLASIATTDIVPVDLNSLLFGLETAIRLGCERAGDRGCVDQFTRRSATRRAAIDRYLWQGDAGVFGDYDWRRRRPTGRLSAAALYPLFTGLARPEQAGRVARVVETQLVKPGGLATTPVATGQQWDLPNGWAPLQWIAVRGLRAYGEKELARTIAQRWIANVDQVYRASGKLVEKYDVIDLGRPGGGGEYPLQDGFGWTNGVTAQLASLYPDPKRCSMTTSPAPDWTATLH